MQEGVIWCIFLFPAGRQVCFLFFFIGTASCRVYLFNFRFCSSSHRYGYTPLPKFLAKDSLDERLQFLVGKDPFTLELIRKWYCLDMNAIPPQYVLHTLTDSNCDEYWNELPRMVAALKGICFEENTFPGLLKVGHSVTEWEVLSAFQKQLQPQIKRADKFFADVSTIDRDLQTSFLWSHRHFSVPTTAGEDPKKLFNDSRDNDTVASQLSALKTTMGGLFPSGCITDHTAAAIHLSGYNSLQCGGDVDTAAQLYLDSFKSFAKDRLMGSLEHVISLKQLWGKDGCGMGLPGGSLAEMLHHCQWAHAKCETFKGREEVVSSALTMVHGISYAKVVTSNPLDGISMCVIGASGAGKTALMAKIAESLFKSNQEKSSSVPIIVRFCGTSAGSRSAKSLICSISEQLELLLGLEQRAAGLLQTETYDRQVYYFQKLLHDHPAVLFIDSLDQLTDENQGRSRISFLRNIAPHPLSRIIVSCLPDEYDEVKQEWKHCYQCETRLREANVQRLVVRMSEDESESTNVAMTLIKDILFQHCSRTLTAAQWLDVRVKVAVEPTALYVHLAVSVVRHWTSDSQGQYSQPMLRGGVHALIEQIFATLERDFGSVLAKAALGFITYSVNGVSDVEMEDLLSMHDAVLDHVFQYATPELRRIPSHVWLRLKQALADLVVERELGCTTWYHRQLKETAEVYLSSEKQQLHVIMAKYFGKIMDDFTQSSRKLGIHEWTICGRSPFDKQSICNVRRCLEGTHHMLAAGMLDDAEKQLCTFECICSMLRAGEAFRLVRQLIELTRLLPGSLSAQHFLRWLQQEVYFLSENPITLFLSSALTQPQISTVKSLGNSFVKNLSARQSMQYARTLNEQIDFSAFISTLEGHSEYVHSIGFSYDGKHIVSGSMDKTVRVWEAATGAILSTLEGHLENVVSVAFSPSGKQILSGSWDKTVRLWDAASGAIFLILEGHTKYVTSVAFCPSGKQILSGSWDKTVRLWDAASGAILLILAGHTKYVTSVAFCPSGEQILSGSWDKTVRLWDAASGAILHILEGHTKYVTSVAFSSDGKLLASGSKDKTVRVCDAATGAFKFNFDGHKDDVNSVAFSPDSNYIVSGSSDCTIHMWNVATDINFLERHLLEAMKSAIFYSLEGHSDGVFAVVYSPDGKYIVSGSSDKTIRVWDAGTSVNQSGSWKRGSFVNSLAFSPDGDKLVSGSSDNIVRVWNMATGDNLHTLKGHSDGVTSVAISPNNTRIASGSKDCALCVWNATTGANLRILFGHKDGVYAVQFSSNSKYIVSGSSDCTVRLWDVESGVNLFTCTGHRDCVLSVGFSYDGKHIVSGSMDKTVRVWNAATGAILSTLEGHSDRVTTVAFSPDDKHIVSGSWDDTVRLWDAETGVSVTTLEGHSGSVYTVGFSYDGKHIVSGSKDRTIRMWDAATGAHLSTLEGHSDRVTSVVFSPNGKQIVSASRDRTIRVWCI